jgi:hypothetical protein
MTFPAIYPYEEMWPKRGLKRGITATEIACAYGVRAAVV